MKSNLDGQTISRREVSYDQHRKIDDSAAELVRRWRRAEEALDARRLEDLRSLSERDSAQQFADLLQVEGPYPLRQSSGLVEQQRIFERLRNQT